MQRMIIATTLILLLCPAAALAVLPAPGGVTASLDSCWGIHISWDALPGADSFYVTDGSDVWYTGDTVYRDTAASAGAGSYWVAGIDLEGVGDLAKADGFRRVTPGPPAGVSASDDSCAVIRVTWSASVDVDTYFVFRNGSPAGKAVAPTLFYRDLLSGAGTFSYTVTAANSCGESGSSAADNGKRLADPPDVPAGLAASNNRCDGVNLSWANVPGEDGYYLYRESVPIDTLLPNATSHLDGTAPAGAALNYQIAAFNACAPNPVLSAGVSGFRNMPAPDPVGGLIATTDLCTGIDLSWVDVEGENGYVVRRGGSPISTIGADETSFLDTLAQPGIPYFYEVGPFNSCSPGPVYNLTAQGERADPIPGKPATVTASDNSCSAVTLTWSAVATADSFRVFRDNSLIVTVPSGTLTYKDSPGSDTYTYGVAAGNSCGWSDSTTADGTVLPGAPSAPATVAASDTSCSMVRLDWSAAADAEEYYIYRDGGLIQTVAAAVLFYEDALGAGTYTYGVAAGNTCGASDSTIADGTVLPAAPLAPATLTASDLSCTSVSLAWSATADADSFRLFRDDALIATVPSATLTYEESPGPDTYTYGVAAGNSCGWSGATEDDGTVLPAAPATPASLIASDTSCSIVRLDWSLSADAGEYEILRGGTPVDSVPGGTGFYEDSPGEGTYSYGVVAMNSCGRSAPAGASGTVLPGAPSAPATLTASDTSCLFVRLDWPATADVDSYTVARNSIDIATIDGALLVFRDTIAPGRYDYSVVATNSCGASAARSDSGGVLPAPAPPTLLTASTDSCGLVRLDWNGTAADTAYYVYRGNLLLGLTKAPFYRDAAITPGDYQYWVGALGVCGRSESLSVAGTRPPDLPGRPASLTASEGLCGVVDLTWDAVATADSYYVYRAGTKIAAVVGETYQDSPAAGTYLYGVAARNICGLSDTTADAGSLFPGTPPVPVIDNVSGDRCDGIRIAWTDVTDEEGYYLYRDASIIDTLAAGDEAYLDSSVLHGVVYSYQVAAFNGCAPAPVLSDPVDGSRLAPPPGQVTGVLLSNDRCDGIDLSWNDVEGEFGFAIERSGTIIDTVGPDQLGYLDSLATPGTIQTYRVGAFNGCSAAPSWSAAIQGERPPGPPVAPAAVTASDDSCGLVRVDWTPSSSSSSYRLFRDSVFVIELTAPQASYRDTSVTGGPFLYEVSAKNSCGESQRAADSGTVPPPSPVSPALLFASNDSCDGVHLVWSDVDDELGYIIYRNGATADSTASDDTTWIDSNAQPGGPAAYTVAAWNSCTITPDPSAPMDGEVLYPPPDSLAGFLVSDRGCNEIRLVWADADGEDGYVIERNGAVLTTRDADVTIYDDLTAAAGTVYSYRVGPFNTCSVDPVFTEPVTGSRLTSVPDSVTGVSASGDSCGVIHIRWEPSDTPFAEADSYFVVNTNTSDIWSFPADMSPLVFRDTLSPPGTYKYEVIAWNRCGRSAAGTDEGTRLPDPPGRPVMISASDALCDGIHLEWSDLDVEDEEGYYIFRDGGLIDSVAFGVVTYVDAGSDSGTSYDYSVGAWNSCAPYPGVVSDTISGFRTILPEPVGNLAASSDNCEGILITWDDVAYEEGYAIKRDGDGSNVVQVEANTVSYLDTDVDPGASHNYQVGPVNACTPGPVFGLSVANGSRPYGPPLAPQNVQATDDKCEVIVVTWDLSLHADNHTIYRDGEALLEGPTLSSFNDTPLPGPHRYDIVASNSCGSSPGGTDAGFRRTQPGAPQNLTASSDRCDGVFLTWEESVSAQSYTVRRDGSPVATEIHFSVLEYLDSGVPGGTQSSYTVEAVNECGATVSSPVIGRRSSGAPQAPSNVAASTNKCDRVDITWSYTGTMSDLVEFRISVRDSGSGVAFDSIGAMPVSENSFTHTPAPGSYEYLVNSVNSCGLSPETEGSKSIGTRKGIPSTPSFNAQSDTALCSGENFILAWDPVEHATSYVITEGINLYSTTATSYGFVRTTAKAYDFRIRAEGDCGASPNSAPFEVKVFSSPSSPTGVSASQDLCGAIQLSWTNGSNSDIWVFSEGWTDTLFLSAETSWVDSLSGGGPVTYHAGGYNLCDTISSAGEVTGFAYPRSSVDPPDAVYATDNLCDSVVVTWSFSGDLDAIRTFRLLRYDGAVSTSIAVVSKDEEYRVVDFPPDAESHLYEVQAGNDCALSLAVGAAGAAGRKPDKPVWTSTAINVCVAESFNLRWQALPGADRYKVYRGSTLFGTVTQPSLLATLYDPGVHDFKVIAENECGSGIASDPLMVLIAEDPVDPAGVTLDSSRCDTVMISWTPQQDSIIVTRSDRIDPVWIGPGNGSVVDLPEQGATYRVRSFNGCGESDGVTASLGSPKLRPPAPTAVSATGSLCDSVIIGWSVPQSDVAYDHLVITRSRNDTTRVLSDTLPPEARRFVDRNGVGEYEYLVVAVNGCGTSLIDETSSDRGEFIPLTAQGVFLQASDSLACTGSDFALHWAPVPGALYYRIWENDEVAAVVESGRDSTLFAATSPGTRSFNVQAFGSCGEGERSDEWVVTVGTLPSVPAALTATDDFCGEVHISWQAPAAPLDGVLIYRGEEVAGFAAWPDTHFADTQALPGVTYQYSAAASGRCGESARSASVPGLRLSGLAAPVLVSPPANAGGLPIPVTMTWNPVTGAIVYHLQVKLSELEEIAVDSTFGAAPSITIAGLELGVPYEWRLAAESDCGAGEWSDWRGFGTIASAPAILASEPENFAVHVPLDATIRVTFNIPIDPTSLAGASLMAGDETIPGSALLESGGSTLLFAPDAPLLYNRTYVLFLNGLRDVFDRPLGGVAPVTFTTVPGARPVGDMDGDFQRSPADVAFAISALVGGIADDSLEMNAADLNGDGRYTVADLVFLANLIVSEGTVFLPGDGKRESVGIIAEVDADRSGEERVLLRSELPYEISAAYLEIELPDGAGDVTGVSSGGGDANLWFAREGKKLRVLLAGEAVPFALAIQLHGGTPLRSVSLSEISCSEKSGALHLLVSDSGGIVPVVPPGSLLLVPNRPNPFNPETEIEYFLSEAGQVRLRVFDITGRVVATLVDRPAVAGWHAAVWDGSTETGGKATSGIYFGLLEANGSTRTIRMALIR